MSMREYFVWSCDGCGVTRERASLGMPEGWAFEIGEGGLKHFCKTCWARRLGFKGGV